jgi:hypothetical protein
MPISAVTWALAALFLVFGVGMLLIEGEPWRHILAGLSTLSLGGFALSMSRDAWQSGVLRLQHSVIRYAQRPRLFMCLVLGIAVAGLVVMGAGAWFLSAKF